MGLEPDIDPDMICDDDDPEDQMMACDEETEVMIPIASFKSNHISKKTMIISAEDMSPTAMGMQGNIFGQREEIPEAENPNPTTQQSLHCVCGNPCMIG